LNGDHDMRDQRRSVLREQGFIQMELMLLIGLVGIGAAIGLPSLIKLLRHQPMSGGNWTTLILGALLALAGVAPFVGRLLSDVSGTNRRR